MDQMRNEKLVNRIMEKVYPEFRYRWCEADACACMGCVNMSQRYVAEEMGASPITRAEWQRWVESHKLITIEYADREYSFTAREWIQAMGRFLQNEINKSERIPSVYESGTCQDCALWGQIIPGGVWGDCRSNAGNIPLDELPNRWGGSLSEVQTKYHFTCKLWCQRGYGPGQDGKEYPPSKVDGVSMGENYD